MFQFYPWFKICLIFFLFFQQLSNLMFDIHAKTVPKNLLDKFVKVSTKQKVLLELVCLFGILFHFLLKLSTYIIFIEK